MEQFDKFTEAYITCALWASNDDNDVPLDRDHSALDIADETLKTMRDECDCFQRDNAELLATWYADCGESEERAGHDFWLTRNHHGAGYWDRWSGGTPQGDIGRKLTDAAQEYGECDLYIGDDGQIYCQ